MNIVLLGATGATGKEVLSRALAAGHTVTALVRTPANVTFNHPNLKIMKGDATDPKALTKAMAGNEVLVSTLGSTKNTSLITDSTKAIITAAKATGLKRIIMMSSFVVNRDQLQGFTKLLSGMAMKKRIDDKVAGETELRSSGLDWTIVYASFLTNDSKATGARVVPTSEKLGMSNKISRGDVATWILNEAKDGKHLGENVTISR